MTATATATSEPPAGNGRPFRRLTAYAVRNRRMYALSAVTTLGYIACFVAVPLLVGWAIEAVQQELPREVVLRRCGILLGVTVLQAALRFFSRTLVFYAARQIEYDLRNDLFRHLQRLPQSFYFRWRTGDIMSRLVNDLNSVRLLLGPGLLNLFQVPILYVAAFVVMLSLNAKLTLLSLFPYPVFVFIAGRYGRAIHRWSLRTQEGLSNLSSFLQERVSGIAVVKAYAMETATADQFEVWNQDLFRRQLGYVRVNASLPTVAALLPAVGMLIVFAVGGTDVAEGRMPLSAFFTFALYSYGLTFPTIILGWVIALVQRGAASMRRIDELLDEEPSIADHPEGISPEGNGAGGSLGGEIEFRGFTFVYPGAARRPALRDVDLHVPAGSTLGVVGLVGAGKSTLASVIPRLYEVEDGQVLLDGVDVNRIPLRVLRSSIAMVPQDPFLFSMTLGQNVAYGLTEDDPEAIARAAERAQLAKDVADLPAGYDTVVGERGVMLSGGQRQRTALARALALDPRILILDDTLSAVDAETEAAIQAELRGVFAGRTVVLVSSRINSVREADQIVVLDGGTIVERGTHEELIAGGGLYARLAEEQEREAELSEVAAAAGVA